MIEVNGSTIWSPSLDEIYESYNGLQSTQKLRMYIGVRYTNIFLKDETYSHMKIDIPVGLYCEGNSTQYMNSGKVEGTVSFSTPTDYIVTSFNISEVICICIIDEE